MGLEQKDLDDVRQSKPVAVVDLWDIDDRIDRLENIAKRLERVLEVLAQLYLEERTKTWELILNELIRQERDQYKKGNFNGNRSG